MSATLALTARGRSVSRPRPDRRGAHERPSGAPVPPGRGHARKRDRRFADETEYAFTNALVREAAHALMTESDRALGHTLAAAWLVPGAPPPHSPSRAARCRHCARRMSSPSIEMRKPSGSCAVRRATSSMKLSMKKQV